MNKLPLIGLMAATGALAFASTASATVPITASLSLSNGKVSKANNPQSSAATINVNSCATPTAACPQPGTLQLIGDKGMTANGSVIPDDDKCDVGSPPSAAACEPESQLGSGTIGIFIAGMGVITPAATVFATAGGSASSFNIALYGTAVGTSLTVEGTVKTTGSVKTKMGLVRTNGSIQLDIPKFTMPKVGSITPIIVEGTGIKVDKTAKLKTKIKGKKKTITQHLIGNPTVCNGGEWTFTVNETFLVPVDSGSATSNQVCKA